LINNISTEKYLKDDLFGLLQIIFRCFPGCAKGNCKWPHSW